MDNMAVAGCVTALTGWDDLSQISTDFQLLGFIFSSTEIRIDANLNQSSLKCLIQELIKPNCAKFQFANT